MGDTSTSSLNETVLSTRDTLSVFEQFISKIQGPYKEKIVVLLETLKKINYELATYSKRELQKNVPFWQTWFATLNKIADEIVDLLNENIKHEVQPIKHNYDDQIQELHQRLAQLMNHENSHLRIIINDDGSIHYTTTSDDQMIKNESDEYIEVIPAYLVVDNIQISRKPVKMSRKPAQASPEYASASISCCSCLPSRSKSNKQLDTDLNLQSKFESKPRLMISYNWDSKEICKKIYDRLRSDGYIVWFDVQNMHGCIYTAMAEAVESSEIILYGMTEKYRHSDNCRKELTYACKKRKRMIPLRLQPKYDPDGWLGLISAELLYIDFTKNNFDTNYQQLLNEMH